MAKRIGPESASQFWARLEREAEDAKIRLFGALQILAEDGIISNGRARELAGMTIYEQRAHLRRALTGDRKDESSDRTRSEILHIRAPAGAPASGVQAVPRPGAPDGGGSASRAGADGQPSEAARSERRGGTLPRVERCHACGGRARNLGNGWWRCESCPQAFKAKEPGA